VVRRYHSGWWLERKYWDEEWTQAEIAEGCGVSPRCIRKWIRNRGVETRELTGENHPQYGSERDEETRAKISESLSGLERSQETRERMSAARTGPRNPQWNGGVSDSYGDGWGKAHERIRERDDGCQHCGRDGDERQLDVHHIVPFRLFEQADETSIEEAHELGNLVLLCRPCHRKAERGEIEFDSSLEPPEWTTKRQIYTAASAMFRYARLV